MFKTGIVSVKELEEDHTVINEEHIKECEEIAYDMMKMQNIEMWISHPELAQNYFEHDLTKLYSRKFGGKPQ